MYSNLYLAMGWVFYDRCWMRLPCSTENSQRLNTDEKLRANSATHVPEATRSFVHDTFYSDKCGERQNRPDRERHLLVSDQAESFGILRHARNERHRPRVSAHWL